MNGYELVRLQENQVKKTGDTMTGNLTMAGGAEVNGNATSSTKLKNARTFTIGNAQPKTFDGTQDLTWTLQEIGAGTGGTNATYKTTVNANQWQANGTNYKFLVNHNLNSNIIHVGGIHATTNESIFVPFKIINNNSLEVFTIDNTLSINITVISEALAAGGGGGNFLPLTGGTMTGDINIDTQGGQKNIVFKNGNQPLASMYSNGNNIALGFYDNKNNRTIFNYLENTQTTSFETSINPNTTDRYTLGTSTNKWRDLYLANSIWGHAGTSGFEINHLTYRNSPTLNIATLNNAQAVVSGIFMYNENNNEYLSPRFNGRMGLGRAGELYRDVWSINGAIQTSDIKAKENIKIVNGDKPITKSIKSDSEVSEQDLLDLVKNINVYSFDYKSANDKDKSIKLKNPSATQLGIIAQEIKDANPNAWKYIGIDSEVQEDGSETYCAIKQGSINGLLLSVVKSLIKQNEEMQKEIEDIKSKGGN